MSEPDISRDIPQALWVQRDAIIIAPASPPGPDPDPEPEPEAGS